MAIYYYCSGFDKNNAFTELKDNFKKELKDTKNLLYIPAGLPTIEKAKEKYIPIYNNHFKNIGIIFDNINILTPDINKNKAKELVNNASFIMLMGGNPYEEKKLIEELEIVEELKKFNGIMLGYSAGAMLMSKYIIIVPCSEEYPDFHIEEGLGLSNISIYPHVNINNDIYPEYIDIEGEITRREDLIKVAKEYEDFYLLQDREDNNYTSVSIIRASNNNIEFIKINNGRIWKVTKDNIKLVKRKVISNVKSKIRNK